MDYVPKPGTIPHKVIRHLETVGSATSAEIYAAVGLKRSSSGTGLIQYLSASLHHGYVARTEPRPGRTAVWRLGPTRMPPDIATRARMPAKRTMPSRRVPVSVFDLARTL